MDTLNKPTKLSKLKKRQKQPLKVVYISSPMKVKTSASQFRALVQELTGRDSDVDRFYSLEAETAVVADEEGIRRPPAESLAHNSSAPGGEQQLYGLQDDVVTPHEMMKKFSDFMSSSPLCAIYEPHMDMLIRGLDAA